MDVSVVVPFRPGCPWRETSWGWVRASLEQARPDWEIIVGSCPDGPWRKALAVADGISRASGDRIVMHDADVWCDLLPEAVNDPAPVVIPHRVVHRLDRDSTVRFMAGQSGPYGYDRDPYVGRPAGGLLVFDRNVWDTTPMDPRFEGWGAEDESWALAILRTIGPLRRLRGDLYHLWHPPQPRDHQIAGNQANHALWRRYTAATSPEQMRELLDEVTTCLCSSPPTTLRSTSVRTTSTRSGPKRSSGTSPV